MTKIAIKIGAAILVTVALLAVAVAGAGLGLRAYRQHQTEQRLALGGPGSIRDGRYVTIGGAPQWISIRGENRKNPVILFLHGGPGAAQSGLAALYRSWERDFTIVQWDQRGAGLTFAAGVQLPPNTSQERMTADGIEVAEYVRRALGVSKIVILGHSWGSVLGVHMVKARPDLFSAYVGTGQVVKSADTLAFAYEDTLARARVSGDEKTLQVLEANGRPPFGKHAQFNTLIATRNRYLIPADVNFMQGLDASGYFGKIINSPDLSLGHAISSIRATMLTAGNLDFSFGPLDHADLPALGYAFPIPFFLIEGEDDRVSYTVLAKAYYDHVNAPHKEMVLIPGGHYAAMTTPDAFRDALLSHVRPVVLDRERAAPN